MACSLPGFSVHGIFQARILEWVTISFSRRSSQLRDWTWVSHIVGKRFTVWATREVLSGHRYCLGRGSRVVEDHTCEWVQFTSLKESCPTLRDPMDCSMSGFCVYHELLELTQTHVHWVDDAINHLVLCRPLLVLPSNFSSIRVFSIESVLHIRWPKYWSFSFSISPSNKYSGLISLRTDWFDLLAVQGTLKSFLQYLGSKASILQCSDFFMVQLRMLRFWSDIILGVLWSFLFFWMRLTFKSMIF